MKRSADQQPVRLSEHAAFIGLRWFAWAGAALALALPGRPAATLARDAGLLLLISVINVVATALAQGYVRLARRRPQILALDLIAGAAVLWLSGSGYLPFMPNALVALVLPALLFGWRGAFTAALGLMALDLFGLTIFNPQAAASGADLAVRLALPLSVAALAVPLGQIWVRPAPLEERRSRRPEGYSPAAPAPADEGLRSPQQGPRSPQRSRPEAGASAPANVAAGSLVLLRAAEQRDAPSRRVIYDLKPAQKASLVSSLEQLAAAAARQTDLEVRVSSTGAPRPLGQAQKSLLLRVAHEALLNVQQHARAHTALVTLAYEGETVALAVCDDGVGLLDGTYERPGLHALRVVRYCLAELDGQLAVFEAEDGGVTVRATLPLET